MVTTRASTKSTATPVATAPIASNKKTQAEATSSAVKKKKSKKTEALDNAEADREGDLPQAGQEEPLSAQQLKPRKVTGKRKRDSGAREASNVSSFRYALTRYIQPSMSHANGS